MRPADQLTKYLKDKSTNKLSNKIRLSSYLDRFCTGMRGHITVSHAVSRYPSRQVRAVHTAPQTPENVLSPRVHTLAMRFILQRTDPQIRPRRPWKQV